jgi:hypothetical protein
MKHVLFAVVTSFALGFAVSAFANQPSTPPPGVGPTEDSCKAAGQPCSDREDCCSRMCRKDNKKCA